MTRFDFINFGGGVQSVTLVHLIVDGKVSRPTAAIFADTGWEPAYVHDQVRGCAELLKSVGVELHTVRKDDVGIRSEYGASCMPLFSSNGMTRRSCTDRYKIAPITRKVRELAGIPKGVRTPRHIMVHQWFGITTDEAHRMRNSQKYWITNEYPLIDLRMSRLDCLNYLDAKGVELPQKSSCVGCPFHSDDYWRWLRDNHPKEWEDACQFDEWMREHGIRGMTGEPRLHRDGQLRSVRLDYDRTEDMFGNECMGLCGT